MKGFLYGFGCGVGMLMLMGISQIGSNYKSEQDISNEFSNLYLNVQPKFWRVQNSTPVARDVGNAEVILFQSTVPTIVPRIYTKISGQTWFVNLISQ